jgi:hypothetical protein
MAGAEIIAVMRRKIRSRRFRTFPGALLHSLDFGPRLDDGEEFGGILFRADVHVTEAIDEPLDEGPLPDGVLGHARQAG